MRAATSPLVHVVIAVIERDGRVLITRRPRGTHLGGLWEFPGGKRRPGESAVACLRREIHEELSISVRVGAWLGRLRYDYPERRVRLAVYRSDLISGAPKPLSSAAVRWVRVDQLSRYEFPPANLPLLQRLSPVAQSC